jgi:hypothetical protein
VRWPSKSKSQLQAGRRAAGRCSKQMQQAAGFTIPQPHSIWTGDRGHGCRDAAMAFKSRYRIDPRILKQVLQP